MSADTTAPRQVLLFSGHMIDRADREHPRFPPSKVAAAAAAISALLDRLDVGPGDLALTEGACGGDLLFARACLARGLALELLQPFEEAEFLSRSVAFAGPAWLTRYCSVRNDPRTRLRSMPTELGALSAGANAYERCNLWLLEQAAGHRAARMRLICLWDGGGGDGPGGTAHMVQTMRQHGGEVLHIDPAELVPSAPGQ